MCANFLGEHKGEKGKMKNTHRCEDEREKGGIKQPRKQEKRLRRSNARLGLAGVKWEAARESRQGAEGRGVLRSEGEYDGKSRVDFVPMPGIETG